MIHGLRRPGNLAYSAQAPLRPMGALENFATTDHYIVYLDPSSKSDISHYGKDIILRGST
jgi:hypothetical protein